MIRIVSFSCSLRIVYTTNRTRFRIYTNWLGQSKWTDHVIHWKVLVLRQMILKGKARGDETSPRETEEGLRPYAGRLDRLAASQECRLLDGGKNLGASLGVELVPVQPKEQALAERGDRSTRVLFQEGSFHDGACSVAHAAPHYQPLFTGS